MSADTRTQIFKSPIYLHHYLDEAQRFTGFKEEVSSGFGGLVFPGDPLFEEYPHGYKFWQMRSVHDAPDWVVTVKLMRDK
jgi:hypothetical protein